MTTLMIVMVTKIFVRCGEFCETLSCWGLIFEILDHQRGILCLPYGSLKLPVLSRNLTLHSVPQKMLLIKKGVAIIIRVVKKLM